MRAPCNKPLPPSATDARICSYECTFCADCAVKVSAFATISGTCVVTSERMSTAISAGLPVRVTLNMGVWQVQKRRPRSVSRGAFGAS